MISRGCIYANNNILPQWDEIKYLRLIKVWVLGWRNTVVFHPIFSFCRTT
jgi:hypothetical protein